MIDVDASDALKFLSLLDAKVQKKILRKGLRTGAKMLLSAVKAETPRRTGVASNNAKIRPGKRAGKGIATLSVGFADKDYVGDQFYIAFVLYGHKVGSRKLGDSRKSVPANPILDRAYDAADSSVEAKIIQTWGDLIAAETDK